MLWLWGLSVVMKGNSVNKSLFAYGHDLMEKNEQVMTDLSNIIYFQDLIFF